MGDVDLKMARQGSKENQGGFYMTEADSGSQEKESKVEEARLGTVSEERIPEVRDK